MKKWTQNEKDILLKNYGEIGAIGCSKLLARQQSAVCKKARKMGLSTISTLGGTVSSKTIVKKINDQRAIVECSQHGKTEHYLSSTRTPVCLICRRLWDKKRYKKPARKSQQNMAQRERYKKPKYNYANRLRRTLRFYSCGQISFSRHLPYSSRKLCDHLEEIKHKHKNKCPMCRINYDQSGYDIDHIVPVSVADSVEAILLLFGLDNLSLLCPKCNRHTKRDLDRKKYGGGVGTCL